MTSSRHLVDPGLTAFLDTLPDVKLTAEMVPLIRQMAHPLPPAPPAAVAAIAMETRHVPGPEGAPEVPVRLYRPKAAHAPLGCIFHIHGGGYIGGGAAQHETLHLALAHELGCAIVSVDYRLAPETAFPGAVEDCYAVLGWLFGEAAALGIDPARIGVKGESAGGGLAAALALLARDRGDHALAFQHLVYPMIDDRTCVATDPSAFAGEFVWTAHSNTFGWRALLGHEPGGADVSPYAAAARATDLAGLPPTYLMTGALDLFVEEDIDYARRLMRAGVPVELHVYPGAYHGFDVFGDAPVSHQARADGLAALRRALA